MQNLTRLLGGAMVALAVGVAVPAFAHGYKLGDLAIGHPWARATPKGAKVGGGYLTVTNSGKAADRLTGASLSDADRVEIHKMSMEGGVMKMRPLPNGIEIKPGGTVKLSPEGNHLMFIGLKAPLKQGDMVKGSLTFQKAGSIDVEFKVDSVGAMAPTHGDHMGGDKMGGMKMQNMDKMHGSH